MLNLVQAAESAARNPPPSSSSSATFADPRRGFCSFEFFPPKTDAGVANLMERMERMVAAGPLFVDVTWRSGGETSAVSLAIAKAARQLLGPDRVMLHMTCAGASKATLVSHLATAAAAGVQCILALRGDDLDDFEEQNNAPFKYAIDLVRLIRSEFTNKFTVAVAGYPEGHGGIGYAVNLKHLKEKVDAGADFIITQMVYNAEVFLQFLQDCRGIGITCPIIPGIMPITNYQQFIRIISLTKVMVPDDLLDALRAVKHDDAAVRDIGSSFVLQLIQQFQNAGVFGVHFYTMNLEEPVVGLAETAGLLDPASVKIRSSEQQELAGEEASSNELHGSHQRLEWGDHQSPAFGDLSDFHLAAVHPPTGFLQHAGRLKTEQDVFEVFAKYVQGDIPMIPWCSNPLDSGCIAETSSISQRLANLNRHGILTINSQPAVNGVPSTDSVFGWGPADGLVYQKAYVEFFCDSQRLDKLERVLSAHRHLTLHAIRADGTERVGATNHTTALTWGVFPNREIVQPTIMDPVSFRVWSTEAFTLWQRHWARLYPASSTERALLSTIAHSYWLVTVVDNNFVASTLFDALDQVVMA
ncbi:methylenetetrahydrofolate reductase [Capsaspora owczarzaki ATCC 30864]|uniref:methylenetetrahydrofolate reductase n=1 Tax=Capsaspora owczarzaki (strain ATCC 30864) TaxID=595528 RepID=UPI000352678F|nr:methylenetetrahydrofolate reductase [Capsaspora owczarzaki ATCC 30864]|eukprot:XP_004344386.2 methylenetetrahydrofolate reductase [Capsaspora owczarzaki ATCC 30864]